MIAINFRFSREKKYTRNKDTKTCTEKDKVIKSAVKNETNKSNFLRSRHKPEKTKKQKNETK